MHVRYVGSARNSPETGEMRGGDRLGVQIGCDAILAPIALDKNHHGHGTHYSPQRTTGAPSDSDADVSCRRNRADEWVETASPAWGRFGVRAAWR
jgi:hypothetical protein